MPLTSDSQGCPPLKYGNPGSQASEYTLCNSDSYILDSGPEEKKCQS